MKEILISRGSQLFARGAAFVMVFLAGWSNVGVTTDQVTSSSETIGLLLAAGVFGLADLLLHSIRNKMNPPSLIAFLLLPGLLLMSGCGKDERVLAGHDFNKRAIENAKKNHGTVQQTLRGALEAETKAHIDTVFEWTADDVAAKATATPTITPKQTVAEMKRLTYLRDKKRAVAEKTTQNFVLAESIANKDLDKALLVNAKLREYANEPGFDFVALMQSLFGGSEEKDLPDSPAESLPAEIIQLPQAAAPPAAQ